MTNREINTYGDDDWATPTKEEEISKMTTLEEFRSYHLDFIKNFRNKYLLYDLNFKEVCWMKHNIKSEEFDKLIRKLEEDKEYE